jgi:hypothetical protein
MTPEDLKRIAELIGGLSSEMQEGFARVDKRLVRIESDLAGLTERFDRQEARLERHGGILQTGSRWVNRMNQWAERIDQALSERDRHLLEHEAA